MMNKLMIMKRYLLTQGCWGKIASEKKMRAASLAGVDSLSHSGWLKNVPMCYTPSLWKKILYFNDDTLQSNKVNLYIQFQFRVTWHEGRIPDLGEEEVSKCPSKPNSTENTCAFCVLPFASTSTNLKIGFGGQPSQQDVEVASRPQPHFHKNLNRSALLLVVLVVLFFTH